MDQEKVTGLIESEYPFLMSVHSKWSLTQGPQDMELVAHALRVILHMGKAGEFLREYQALVQAQHEGGGWGRESDNSESAAWVSAFCGLMLIRANAILKDAQIEQSIWKSIRYFLDAQESDGRWKDKAWGDLDTTSHPVSFFNVVLALGEEKMKEAVVGPWKKGLGLILDSQSGDGGWYDQTFHPTGVETTAHLGQDSLAASFTLPEGLAVQQGCDKALQWILDHQAPEGSWDDQNMDHTMDCTRSTLLLSRLLKRQEECRRAVEKAMEWIVANKSPQGWPDFPGEATNLERICDGLDVLLKYQAWVQEDPNEVVRRWGYVPGNPTFLSGVTSFV